MTPEWQRYQELQNTRSDCFFVMDTREPERSPWPGRVKLAVVIIMALIPIAAGIAHMIVKW